MTSSTIPPASTDPQSSLLEAIDALMAKNRAQRDPAIERELVRLRHEAFAELDRVAGVVPTDDDSTPAPAAVERDGLDAQLLRNAILQHGSLHVRAAVPPDRVQRLVEGIDRALEEQENFLDDPDRRSRPPWYEPFRPPRPYPGVNNRQLWNRRMWVRGSGGVWAADSPRMLFELFDALHETGIADVITAYLGGRPALAVDKCTLRRVPVHSDTNWHQDGAFLGSGIRTVNLWLALTRCGEDAPGLDVVPARLDRIVETGTDGATFHWSVGQGVVDRVAVAAPVRRPVFEPGDALFFDDMFLHRTAVDPAMTRERHAIESWFFAPSAYPDKYVPIVC